MSELFIVMIVFVISMLSNFQGWSAGQASLCTKQFQGEMHEGKCVKVQREEVK